jgi:phage/plasmid-like protein (TIGR03299 family)
MSHNIAKILGKDAFVFVGNRKDIWHALGTSVASAMTAAECMKLAHLDFTAIKNQNYARNPLGEVVPVDTWSVFRDDNNALLGSGVGKGFTLFQPASAFSFIDTLLEAHGGAHYDTAGCLGKGETIFLSVRIPAADIEITAGDKLEASLVFTTAFDGSGASTCYISYTRPVCANTLRAGLADNFASLRVRHTRNQDSRFEQASRLMKGVPQTAKSLQEKLQLLAERKMTRESVNAIFDRLFPVAEDKKHEPNTKRDNVLAEILSLYESNDNNAFPTVKGSAYNLLNAVTEYTDHYRGAKLTAAREGYTVAQARAENAAVGTGEALKSSALELILEHTENAPAMVRAKAFAAAVPASTGSTLLDSVVDATV